MDGNPYPPAPAQIRRARIPYALPSITALELDYAADAAAHGWGSHCNDYIERFQRDFSRHLDVPFAVATSSCTGAMHLGLAALGIGPGDEVLIADVNWIASASAVTYTGARPVLVDILPDSWCIDPAAARAAITPRTRAIIAVHLYGNLCDLDALQALADEHGLVLIEDAAEAVGSWWHGRRAGSLGRFGTFSFHGTKTLSTGEGGMFVTADKALHERVLTLNNHGRPPAISRQFWSERLGFKYKISNLQAAIGCAQLERVEDLVARKREVFLAYADALRGLPLTMNPEPAGTVNGYWMPTVIVNADCPFDRSALLGAFDAEGIDGRIFFNPLSMMPMFRRELDNPVAYALHDRGINLPSYHDMTGADILRVSEVVRRCLRGAQR